MKCDTCHSCYQKHPVNHPKPVLGYLKQAVWDDKLNCVFFPIGFWCSAGDA